MTDIIKAFLTGGLLCSLVQILLDRTKLMPGRNIGLAGTL